jgi:hypothetical protein
MAFIWPVHLYQRKFLVIGKIRDFFKNLKNAMNFSQIKVNFNNDFNNSHKLFCIFKSQISFSKVHNNCNEASFMPMALTCCPVVKIE